MTTKSAQKGSVLEHATAFIQETLLKRDPNFKVANFSIETNKTVIIAGVRHEIDLTFWR